MQDGIAYQKMETVLVDFHHGGEINKNMEEGTIFDCCDDNFAPLFSNG